MNDVATLIRGDLDRAQAKAKSNRDRMPDGAALIDSVTAVFGPVKVKWTKANGIEMGKPFPFEGTDVDKLIRLDDASKKRRAA